MPSNKKLHENYKRQLRREEVKFLPHVKKYMELLRTDLTQGLSKARGRNIDKITSKMADWDELQREGEIIFKPPLISTLKASGDRIFTIHIQKQEAFDPISQEAVDWAILFAGEQITNINDATMKAIHDIIVKFVPEGESIQNYAKLIRPLVGLNAPQAASVSKLYANMLEEGATEAQILKAVTRKANKLHRLRALTIARTETAYALSEGQRQAYNQLGFKTLIRVESPDSPDAECADNHLREYTIAESEGVLPEHPNCEGTWVAGKQ